MALSLKRHRTKGTTLSLQAVERLRLRLRKPALLGFVVSRSIQLSSRYCLTEHPRKFITGRALLFGNSSKINGCQVMANFRSHSTDYGYLINR